MSETPYTILFDLYASGHHGPYLEQAARAWLERDEAGRLGIAAPPVVFEERPGLRSLIESESLRRIIPIPLSNLRGLSTDARNARIALTNDLVHGRVLRRLVESEKPSRTVLMYADHVQMSLAIRLRSSIPVRFTGIHFRPTLHYQEAFGARERPMHTRIKRTLLAAALRNPHVDRWLSLDPYAVETIRRIAPETVHVSALPDAVDATPALRDSESIRAEWGVEPGRRIVLFLGTVNSRKGIHEILAALPHLDQSDQRRIALVIAGAISPGEYSSIRQAISETRAKSAVQIILTDRYVPDQAIQDVIRASHAMLVAYREHVGSSAILIRAAAVGVPVVGPDTGLMARYIRDHRLGLTCSTRSAQSLATAMVSVALPFASRDFTFDRSSSKAFAARHSLRAFANVLFPGPIPTGSRWRFHPPS